MQNNKQLLVAVVLTTLTLSGCSMTQQQENAAVGTAVGAVAGAGISGLTGGNVGVGTAVGAGIGAVGGALMPTD